MKIEKQNPNVSKMVIKTVLQVRLNSMIKLNRNVTRMTKRDEENDIADSCVIYMKKMN